MPNARQSEAFAHLLPEKGTQGHSGSGIGKALHVCLGLFLGPHGILLGWFLQHGGEIGMR